MILNIANSIPPDLKEALQAIGILIFLLATLDNYLLIRYGGKVNRGFTIWKQPLNVDEKKFLDDLGTDIVDEKVKRFGVRTVTKKDFIMKTGTKVLIRFNDMGQRTLWTSWPLVGYIDLSLPEPHVEYRLSLLMLILTVLIMLINVIAFIVLILAFILSWFYEAGSLRNYLSDKSVFYHARKNHLQSKGIS